MMLARAAVWISRRLLKRDGGVIGGRVLAKLAPGAADQLAGEHRVVLVSATNGKSTSTAMVAAAWATSEPVSTNADGANTPAGLLWTMATATSVGVVLEVDEAWVPWAIRMFRPEVVVLLNLARDQLHRNPEVGRIARAWREALPAVPIVVANADDPWVAWAAETGGRQIWIGGGQIWDEDSVICPACGSLLDRTDGWACTSCDRARPAIDWTVSGTTIVPPSGEPLSYSTLPGPNTSNAAHALAAAEVLGADPAEGARALAAVTNVEGRYSTVRTGDHEVLLVLAKNPASWRASLDLIADRRIGVVLAFNAEGVDGLDTSWLYDVDFTGLRGRQVTLCGSRATDLAVRLEMDGVEVIGQYESLRGALHPLQPGPVDLVATYSAFQEARRELSRAS